MNLVRFRMEIFCMRKVENLKEISVLKLLFDVMSEDGDTVECCCKLLPETLPGEYPVR